LIRLLRFLISKWFVGSSSNKISGALINAFVKDFNEEVNNKLHRSIVIVDQHNIKPLWIIDISLCLAGYFGLYITLSHLKFLFDILSGGEFPLPLFMSSVT
jgi:hypothetical protein